MNSKFKAFFIGLIDGYQKILSPDKGFLKKIGVTRKQVCVFYPTCSEYTKQAIQKYGVFKGFYLGFLRILRCHPWQKNHMDPLK
ncbi:MAG: membrane protein insertion efficiency factor YidD [bacterium]